MENLIIIEKQDFLRDMVELCLQEEGVEVIGLKDANDYEYLLKDVVPQIFIIDIESIAGKEDEIIRSYKNYHPPKGKILFVFTGVNDDASFLEKNSIKAPFLAKPLSPNGLRGKLKNLLESHG